jgi:hypothetical protein
LYDRATRARLVKSTNRSYAIAFASATVLVGLLVGGYHHEEPFLPHLLGVCAASVPWWDCEYSPWLDVTAGVVAFAIFGALAALAFLFRRTPPTVYCNGCDGMGWIDDLLATEGICPRCGGGSFTYFIIEPTGVPAVRIWRDEDVPGKRLIALRSDKPTEFF